MDLSRHVELFTDFADSHLTGDETHDYNIRLKREHSLRVLENGRDIIKSESITGHVADLATLASLYHDIGRFPQFTRYNTYKDADSVNHGRMGVLTLRTLDLPGSMSDRDLSTIRAAVGLHNAKTLNPETNGTLRTVVNVVRDADKVDIYNVILDHLSSEDNSQGVVIHSLEEHPTHYSEFIYDTIMSDSPCEYGMLRYSNDFILLLIGWLFTLNFTTSMVMLRDRGLLEKAFGLLPNDDKIGALENKANEFMRYKTHSPS